MGRPGNRDGRSRPAGIGVQHLVVDDDALRGIGSQDRRRRSDNGDRLLDRDELLELQLDPILCGSDRNICDHRNKGWRLGSQFIIAGRNSLQNEVSLNVAGRFAHRAARSVLQFHLRPRHGRAPRVEDAPGDWVRYRHRQRTSEANNGKCGDGAAESHMPSAVCRYLDETVGFACSLASFVSACSEPRVFNCTASRR